MRTTLREMAVQPNVPILLYRLPSLRKLKYLDSIDHESLIPTIVLLAALVASSPDLSAQSPFALGDSLLAINYDSYYGRPVQKLIKILPAGYEKRYIASGSRPFYADYLYILYPGNYAVLVYVRPFQFMNRKDPCRAWDFNLFRKEKTNFVVLMKDNACIKNCNHPDYLESLQ
ncbi:MAG: hypothetical protein JWP27_2562 [Flaviaesturariibacter sp.]|nr:hypothetical protein [Flaviaesturariibacter sp.]